MSRLDGFVAWYRGPRGAAVKCLVLGFNAGVVIPVEPGPIAMATAVITALIVFSTLHGLSRQGAP